MKETTTRILCDICNGELEPYVGLSQFQYEWTAKIVIEQHQVERTYKDFCAKCNCAILDLINDRRP